MASPNPLLMLVAVARLKAVPFASPTPDPDLPPRSRLRGNLRSLSSKVPVPVPTSSRIRFFSLSLCPQLSCQSLLPPAQLQLLHLRICCPPSPSFPPHSFRQTHRDTMAAASYQMNHLGGQGTVPSLSPATSAPDLRMDLRVTCV